MKNMMTLKLLSKGDLCRMFSLYRGQRLDYRKLRQKILTDEALEEIGMTPEEYRQIRGDFDYQITRKIVKYLRLEVDESN